MIVCVCASVCVCAYMYVHLVPRLSVIIGGGGKDGLGTTEVLSGTALCVCVRHARRMLKAAHFCCFM